VSAAPPPTWRLAARALLEPAADQQVQTPNDCQGACYRQRRDYPEEHSEKSIASMHSLLSLAVGYNTESLPTVDALVTTLWQLSRRIRLPRCSEARCRSPASIMPLAALGGPILQRGPSLCTLGALRRSLSGATMTTPGGAGTLRKAL
jgi:hypothetical protein